VEDREIFRSDPSVFLKENKTKDSSVFLKGNKTKDSSVFLKENKNKDPSIFLKHNPIGFENTSKVEVCFCLMN
jgi:hypothetical protein